MGAAAGGGRPHVPPRLLPPAHRRAPAGSTSTGSRPTPTACPPRSSPATTASRSRVTVPIGEREVVAQIWRVDVGRVPLLLLDADRPENDLDRPLDHVAALRRRRRHAARPVRAARHRRRAGAARARHRPGRRAPQRGPRRAGLPRARARRARAPASLGRGRVRGRAPSAPSSPPTRRCRRATTPTRPRRWPRRWPASRPSWASTPTTLVRRGRTHPDEDAEPFGVTQFALRSSRIANGVSARHGEVAREMWHGPVAGPAGRGRADHARHQRRAHPDLDRRADARAARPPPRRGLDRPRRSTPRRGSRLDAIPDARAVGGARARSGGQLIDVVRERSVIDRLGRGDTAEYVRAAAEALDPDVLTIGFARRVATYKRLDLLLRDVDRALALLGDDERPVQLILAGKAHPKDDEGKRLVQRLFEMKSPPRGRPPRRLPRRLRPRARRRDGARLRRLGQRPAAAAGGERDERHQVGDERRPAAERARRLVAGGLRRHATAGRSPARSTTTTAPRTGATPPSCTGC